MPDESVESAAKRFRAIVAASRLPSASPVDRALDGIWRVRAGERWPEYKERVLAAGHVRPPGVRLSVRLHECTHDLAAPTSPGHVRPSIDDTSARPAGRTHSVPNTNAPKPAARTVPRVAGGAFDRDTKKSADPTLILRPTKKRRLDSVPHVAARVVSRD